MTKDQKLRKALQYAKDFGIKIERGACFDWTCPNPNGGTPIRSGDKPSACNIYGAILLSLNKEKDSIGWKDGEEYLGVNTVWMYRLHIGFNNLHQLLTITKDKKTGKIHYLPDKVSKLGIQLAKEFCK